MTKRQQTHMPSIHHPPCIPTEPLTADDWRDLWRTFDTPLDSNDRLLEPFRQFPAGTDHDTVLAWFDGHSPQGVAALMYP